MTRPAATLTVCQSSVPSLGWVTCQGLLPLGVGVSLSLSGMEMTVLRSLIWTAKALPRPTRMFSRAFRQVTTRRQYFSEKKVRRVGSGSRMPCEIPRRGSPGISDGFHVQGFAQPDVALPDDGGAGFDDDGVGVQVRRV